MENNIEKLIEDNLNPYIAVRINTFHNEKEHEEIENKIRNKFDKEFDLIQDHMIVSEKSLNNNYIITNQNTLDKFTNMLDEFNVKYKISDALDEIWNMEDIEKILPEYVEDPCPELTSACFPGGKTKREKVIEILKVLFNRKYSIDDVLELERFKDGKIESLNEINKYILQQKTH